MPKSAGSQAGVADAVYHLAEDGRGRAQVMEALGISTSTLARAIRVLKDQGRYHPALDAGPFWNRERTTRLIAMVQAGLPSGEIAVALGRSAAAIRSRIVVLRRLGLICPQPRRSVRVHRAAASSREGLS